eukprot:794131-Pleurochrysis_carterae.AAC.1
MRSRRDDPKVHDALGYTRTRAQACSPIVPALHSRIPRAAVRGPQIGGRRLALIPCRRLPA